MGDRVEKFSEMIAAALGDRIAQHAEGFVEMLSENAVMEFPYAPPNLPARLDGRRAIAAYLTDLATKLVFDRIDRPTVHQTSDPDVTILEFSGSGHGVAGGAPYEQSYISVIRTHDGRIVHYRDYWNPLAILAALEGQARG